jgi:hypothetical protein
VDEIHQDLIADIAYQTQLDQEETAEDAAAAHDPERGNRGGGPPPLLASDVRYWSDYSRVHYLPRSINKLPDLADWEAADDGGGDWRGGKDAFLRYDSVSSLCAPRRVTDGA